MAKVKYEDLFALVEEIERGANDRTRTIGDIENDTVKRIVVEESSMAISAGVTASIVASGAVATSTLIGTLGGAGLGVVSTSMTALGVGVLSATAGAATGGTVGSAVPIVGTIIGAVVGAGIGLFASKRIQNRKSEKKEALMQKVISKQNSSIKDLEAEFNELKQKYGKLADQNERYKYILGILMANEELKGCE